MFFLRMLNFPQQLLYHTRLCYFLCAQLAAIRNYGMSETSFDTEDFRIPVTVLTGFLGSGKTTL
ncbi:MAG: hypothetical protein QMB71_04780, partial [Tolumonas sp.]